MKKEYFLLFIGGLIILVAVILRITKPYELNQEKLNQILRSNDDFSLFFPDTEDDNIMVNNDEIDDSSDLFEPIEPVVLDFSEEVEIFYPQANDAISSPLEISGQARGFWFFEASLPVRLVDLEGNLIVEHYAQAQNDWMTTDFVPLSASLVFNTTATSGFLVIAKDNPSGLPEYDASISIPVIFNFYE